MLRLILRTNTDGVKIAIESISINPTISATIKYKYLKVNQPIENYEYVMAQSFIIFFVLVIMCNINHL
jgi:hypothetical protein